MTATTHPDDWSFEELAAALRAGAAGRYADEAGVELLVAHRTWLVRPEFRALIDCITETEAAEYGRPAMAWIAWDLVHDACLPSSPSERHVLRLAASITAGYPVSLLLALSGLDTVSLTAVVAAVLHAAGYPAATVLLTSDPTGRPGERGGLT